MADITTGYVQGYGGFYKLTASSWTGASVDIDVEFTEE